MNYPSLLCTRTHRAIGRFANDDSGATAVEYGLVVALVSIGIMAAVFSTGEGIKVTLNEITTVLANMI